MSQQDSLTYKGFGCLFFDFSDLSTEVKEATEIANTQCKFAVMQHKYFESSGKFRTITHFWINEPFLSGSESSIVRCNSDEWLQYHLIRDLPWIDILKHFVDAKERKND